LNLSKRLRKLDMSLARSVNLPSRIENGTGTAGKGAKDQKPVQKNF